MWQGDVLQVTLANQIADSKPDSGIAQAPAAAARLVSLVSRSERDISCIIVRTHP